MELSKSIPFLFSVAALIIIAILYVRNFYTAIVLVIVWQKKVEEKNHISPEMDEEFEKTLSFLLYFFIFQNSLLRIYVECVTKLLVLCSKQYIHWVAKWGIFSTFFFSSKALHSTSHKMPFENISALNATTGNEIENLMRNSEIDKSLNYFSRSFFHSLSFLLAYTMSHLRVVEIVSNAMLPSLQIGFSWNGFRRNFNFIFMTEGFLQLKLSSRWTKSGLREKVES